MKPSQLQTGHSVRRSDNPAAPSFEFIERDAQRRQSVLRCAAYRGQNGADDAGIVHVSDWDMARKFVRVPS